jgi:hypothetical protein
MLAIDDGEFYLVTIGGTQRLFAAEADAIDHLRSSDLDPEAADVSVVHVTVDGEDWQIRELPWQRIALQLLGGDA